MDMKTVLALVSAVAIAAPTLAVPQFAAAQSARSYGTGDICAAQKRAAGNKGAVVGGLFGAFAGSQLAGHGARTEGTILGAGVGAVAGHEIAKRNVHCTAYPSRISYHRANCKWVSEYYGGRNHSFEVCRGRDGVWRPSGRG
jgi:uncharacterized protein YcfJ